jgi:hypothetical protein
MIDSWPFVIAAYAVALGATAGLIFWAWASMRRAEAGLEELRRK